MTISLVPHPVGVGAFLGSTVEPLAEPLQPHSQIPKRDAKSAEGGRISPEPMAV